MKALEFGRVNVWLSSPAPDGAERLPAANAFRGIGTALRQAHSAERNPTFVIRAGFIKTTFPVMPNRSRVRLPSKHWATTPAKAVVGDYQEESLLGIGSI